MTTTRTYPIARRFATLVALGALITTVTTTLLAGEVASAAPARVATTAPAKPVPAKAAPRAAPDDDDPAPPARKTAPTGKLNLNLASEDQLQLLPGVGPAKADRIVAWRKKNGGFKRVADLRKVKGFGYKTLKKLEPWLDIKGETTLASPQ